MLSSLHAKLTLLFNITQNLQFYLRLLGIIFRSSIIYDIVTYQGGLRELYETWIRIGTGIYSLKITTTGNTLALAAS
jgi:hypothetical protein